MKIQLSKLVSEEFNQACFEFSRVKMPLKSSYDFKKFMRKMSKELEIINQVRLETLKNYADLDDSGNIIFDKENKAKFTKPEKRVDFQNEYQTLLSKEVDIEFTKIKISDVSNSIVEPWVLESLDFIFEEDQV